MKNRVFWKNLRSSSCILLLIFAGVTLFALLGAIFDHLVTGLGVFGLGCYFVLLPAAENELCLNPSLSSCESRFIRFLQHTKGISRAGFQLWQGLLGLVIFLILGTEVASWTPVWITLGLGIALGLGPALLIEGLTNPIRKRN